MASCQELADDRWARFCATGESAARRRSENAAAERREARRPTLLAGDLRDPEIDPIARPGHGVRRSAPAPVGALLPSFWGAEMDEGIRRPSKTGRRSFGCLTIESWMDA